MFSQSTLGDKTDLLITNFVFLVPEAVLIATPFYGGITQSVFLYGNVKLVYVYLDSKVRSERRE